MHTPQCRATPRAGAPATKPGKHGTLYLYRITYKNAHDGGSPEFTKDTWAYSLDHIDDITQSWSEDGWEIVSVARVPADGGSMHRAIKHRTQETGRVVAGVEPWMIESWNNGDAYRSGALRALNDAGLVEHQVRPLEHAKAAGAQYASDQINGDYFADWVREQMIEANRMNPSERLPLETKADAKQIARNMLQQLEWDTKRDLRANEIERLLGIDRATPDVISAFYDGLHRGLSNPSTVDWLADEILEMTRPSGRVEAPRVQDYIAVDRNDRRVAGPFRSRHEAEGHVPAGGYVKFSSATHRKAPPAPSSYPKMDTRGRRQ